MFHPNHTVGCDAHKHFSLFAVLDEKGDLLQRTRVGHALGAILGTNRISSCRWTRQQIGDLHIQGMLMDEFKAPFSDECENHKLIN